MDRQLVAKMRV